MAKHLILIRFLVTHLLLAYQMILKVNLHESAIRSIFNTLLGKCVL